MTKFGDDSYVYFIRNTITDAIKIGVSIDIERRMGDLSSDLKTPLEFLGYADGGCKLESYLHNRFSKTRLGGEWFAPDEDLLDYIEKNATKIMPNPVLVDDGLSGIDKFKTWIEIDEYINSNYEDRYWRIAELATMFRANGWNALLHFGKRYGLSRTQAYSYTEVIAYYPEEVRERYKTLQFSRFLLGVRFKDLNKTIEVFEHCLNDNWNTTDINKELKAFRNHPRNLVASGKIVGVVPKSGSFQLIININDADQLSIAEISKWIGLAVTLQGKAA